MRVWTVVFFEGAHDLLAVRGALRALGWEQTREELPGSLENLGVSGRRELSLPLTRLRLRDRGIVLYCVDGINNVLGKKGKGKARICADHMAGFGVDVDADLLSPSARRDAFRDTFAPVFPASAQVEPGRVLPGAPRLGLWVFPDNHATGSLEDVLLAHVEGPRADLAWAARTFVESPAFSAAGLRGSDLGKAILGAMGQADAPARSLPSAMMDERQRWFPDGWQPTGPLLEVVRFIEALSGP